MINKSSEAQGCFANPPEAISGNTRRLGFSTWMIVSLWRMMNKRNPRPQDPAVRRAGLIADIKVVSRVGTRGVRESWLPASALADGSIVQAMKVYLPVNGPVRSTMLYFHGGGYVVGSPEATDGLCRLLCRKLGMAIYSLDYRLAPEHPYPAALDDAVAAYRFVREDRIQREVPLLVGGDSAGGHLATTLCLRLARFGLDAPDGQVLLYPVTDFSAFETASYRQFANGYVLEKADMEWFRSCYVPDSVCWQDPLVSPLHCARPVGQPPALVLSAEVDVLRDEIEAWAKTLADAGVSVQAYRMAGAIHGFATMTSVGNYASRTVQAIGKFLSDLH